MAKKGKDAAEGKKEKLTKAQKQALKEQEKEEKRQKLLLDGGPKGRTMSKLALISEILCVVELGLGVYSLIRYARDLNDNTSAYVAAAVARKNEFRWSFDISDEDQIVTKEYDDPPEPGQYQYYTTWKPKNKQADNASSSETAPTPTI